uniref:Ig-like domain-containing protein n=1 Tax=Labrus bergylta TaxID=56723 RepID=A0A3Q3F6B0_9LABR
MLTVVALCQPRVIGSTQPIRASPGDDVILPCHVEPPVDVVRLTVEWSKPDLQPDPDDRLGDVGYVHLYRDRHEVLDMKIPSYARRTELLPDDLRRGNISLRMMNVSLEDGGRYRCFIPKLSKSRVRSSIIHLVVGERQMKEAFLIHIFHFSMRGQGASQQTIKQTGSRLLIKACLFYQTIRNICCGDWGSTLSKHMTQC